MPSIWSKSSRRVGDDSREQKADATLRRFADWQRGCRFTELLGGEVFARADDGVELTVGHGERLATLVKLGERGVGGLFGFVCLGPIGAAWLVTAHLDERGREAPELVAQEVAIGGAAAAREVERQHALIGSKEVRQHGAHTLKRIAGVRHENRAGCVDARRSE